MTPEEWQRIRPILESALELDPSTRSKFLDGACPDASLRREVQSLIAVHERAGTNALEPGSALSLPAEEQVQFRLPPGKRIGAYEIVEEIAVGGMGAVYRAIRADGQYQQQVALKIVRSELGAESTAARFRNERQILASLDHHNIAKILDGGTTTDGLPYFVMEFIDGLPITDYCEQKKLTIDERLKIFRTVCSAVHYAHQHLVIHRDIKPRNILMTSDGVPKLLDFGIAKILDPSVVPGSAAVTLAGLWVMTPEYASPEQLRGEPITTASDVYSLGLVFYEILTGTRAYRFDGQMPHEVARIILETDPENPSTAVRGGDRPLAGGLHGASPEKLSKVLQGDLDNIVLKAIRKEPGQRYSSADQLSEDIRRHLEGLPVFARKSTFAYRCRKYVLRHRIGVTAAALILVSLVAGITLTLREARIARANQLRAERRFNDVRALANSLLFDIHDAIRDVPGSTPARKILIERALQYLDSLAGEAGNDASLLRELATAYERVGEVQGHYLNDNLGDAAAGLRSYQKALQVRQQLAARSGDWHDQLALSHCHRILASQLLATGDTHSAFDNVRKAVALGESLRLAHSKEATVLDELSSGYTISGHIQGGDSAVDLNDQSGALQSYRKAVEVDEAMLQVDPGSESVQHSLAMDRMFLGDSLLVFGDQPGALQNYQRTLEITQSLAQHTAATRRQREVAVAYNRIAGIYMDKGDWKHVLENNQKALEIYQGLIVKDPQNALLRQGLAIAWVNVGNAIGRDGNRKDGLTDIGKGIDLMQAIIRANPKNQQQRGILAAMHVTRAENLAASRKWPEVLKEYEAALDIYDALYKLDASNQAAQLNAAASKAAIGAAMNQMSKVNLAQENLRQALAVVEPFVAAKTPDQQALYTAADTYAGLGDIESHAAAIPALEPTKSRKHWESARLWYARSLDTWKRIERPTRVSPNGFDADSSPEGVTKNLRRCDAALQGFDKIAQRSGIPVRP
jgi:eukaryotic-like serine/threonine-protein kinase